MIIRNQGLIRIEGVLDLLNISRTDFLAGVKDGRYPAGKNQKAWVRSDIEKLRDRQAKSEK